MTNTTKNLAVQINEAFEAMKWLEMSTKDRVPPVSTERVILSLCLMQHTQLISGSILVLLANKHPSGAFALARSLFESYLRAIWTLECASENELQDIIVEKKDDKGREKQFPRISCLIKDIEERRSDHARFIQKVKAKLDILNDWVHVGIQTCARQFDGENIRPMYSVEDQFDLLNSFVKPILLQSGVKLLDRLGLGQEYTLLAFARVIGQELEVPNE